mgnify:CR=1 FL=1
MEHLCDKRAIQGLADILIRMLVEELLSQQYEQELEVAA